MQTVVLIGGPMHGETLKGDCTEDNIIPENYDLFWWHGSYNHTKMICTHTSIQGNKARNQAVTEYHAVHQDLFVLT